MGKRLPGTPRSKVKNALRQLWLRSRERAEALKRAGYCCQECGVKQSKAKGREVMIEVDHVDGIDWAEIMDLIYARLLVPPEKQRVMCVACHDKRHEADNQKGQ